jgi:hypothetical protein
MNKVSTPVSIFLLSFMEVFQLLGTETNKYYNQYLDTLDDAECLHLPDMTAYKIYIFLALIIQVERDVRDIKRLLVQLCLC